MGISFGGGRVLTDDSGKDGLRLEPLRATSIRDLDDLPQVLLKFLSRILVREDLRLVVELCLSIEGFAG